MLANHLADATDLQQWAERVEARSNLPELIRRLILATSNPICISFRAQEGTDYSGWDGQVKADKATTYVPAGVSKWEIGTSKDPKVKADSEYNKRTKESDLFDPLTTTFVFCTPRRWPGKDKWLAERRNEGKWHEVRAYDADDLATWLAEAPAVHIWFSMLIGKPAEKVQDLASWWHNWAAVTSPPLSSAFLLSGRRIVCEQLIETLMAAPSVITVRAESSQEALAFVAAAIDSQSPDFRDKLFSRALLVEDRGAWRYFASQRKSLILIPHFQEDREAALLNQAIQNGNHVVFPVGADYRLQITVEVPRLSTIEAQKVLEQEGLPPVKARSAAAYARRSLSAYRRLQATVPPDIPPWANDRNGPTLILCVLVGKWNEAYEGDREAIERLVQRSYREIKTLLLQWRDNPDAPFRLIGSCWSVNAKEDAWRLLSRYTTKEDICTFVGLVQEVLLEQDPKHGLYLKEQQDVDMQGTQRRFSSDLRKGLADSLAMLGALGSLDEQKSIADGYDPSDFAILAVRNLMERALEAPEVWLKIADYLSDLAEAAPETFLKAVERDLEMQTPTQLILFESQPRYAYPNLLWALEQLAWSPMYFSRVAIVLARLAAIAPQTQIDNSPFESLLSFFRLWFPQCGATSELRLQTLNQIRSITPDIAWNLMVRLLPTRLDSASVLSGPRARAVLWQKWPCEALQPNKLEYDESVKAVSKWLLEDVTAEPTRWLTLIEHLHHLHQSFLDEALRKLETVPSLLRNDELKEKLWARLRDLISKHRAHSGTDWAMPEALLTRLDPIRDALAPDDPVRRYGWLFNACPQLDVKFEFYQEELDRRRVTAIREIMSTGGLSTLFAFVETIEFPNEAGSSLYSINLEPDMTREVIAALGRTEACKQLALGFISKAISDRGRDWINEFLNAGTLETWDDEMRALALLCLPVDSTTLDQVDSYSEKTRQIYWSRFKSFCVQDTGLVPRIVENLINNKRPWEAFYLLARHGYEFDPPIVQKVLYHSLVMWLEQDSVPFNVYDYDVRQCLMYLRQHPDSDKKVLEQLEWLYLSLPIYIHEYPSLYLHERLAADPAFFVEVVGLLCKRDTHVELFAANSEKARRAAVHLLDSWQSVPGLQSDGTLNGAYLKEWVKKAITLLEAADLKNEGLMAIGKMLRWGPNEQDGAWPDPAICDLIQELSSDLVDACFEEAIYNSRGTTSRGLFDGVEHNRELIERCNRYAEKTESKWPRVSSVFRRLAESYRADERRNNLEAEIQEDDLG